jgi:hypothetical protein
MDITLKRIVESMDAKGIKKIDLTNHLGMVSSAFGNWIAGRNKSYHKYLYQISDYLDVSVEYLKGETDEKKPASKNTTSGDNMFSDTDRKIFEALANMSQSDKEWFLAMIETIKSRRG